LPVRAVSTSTGERGFTGTLTAIDSRADPQTRSIRVNALFDNADEALKPGVFMSVEVELGRRENAVVVPEDAVVPQGARSFVFVVVEGRAEQRPVTLGIRERGTVEIGEGVQSGEDVVVRGVQKLRDKQAVAPRPFRPQS
jgi:membrane fusion protein (multidrug efflux system)